jgi:hypothetical protein
MQIDEKKKLTFFAFCKFIGSPTTYKLCQLILLHIHEQDINTPYVVFKKNNGDVKHEKI